MVRFTSVVLVLVSCVSVPCIVKFCLFLCVSGSLVIMMGVFVQLSYCWDNQKAILKIKERLVEEGFRVWIDTDSMQGFLFTFSLALVRPRLFLVCWATFCGWPGSILEAMAKAIEECDLVVMGCSSGYKESANCRIEAEYMFNCKKNFIPLMMQDYRPNGWLGHRIPNHCLLDFFLLQQNK